MTPRRLLLLITVSLVIETIVFRVSYADLIALSVSGRDAVSATADCSSIDKTLRRSELTRLQLERLADRARACGDPAREILVLRSLEMRFPADDSVRLRLADRLRQAQRFDEAESLLDDLLKRLESQPGGR